MLKESTLGVADTEIQETFQEKCGWHWKELLSSMSKFIFIVSYIEMYMFSRSKSCVCFTYPTVFLMDAYAIFLNICKNCNT